MIYYNQHSLFPYCPSSKLLQLLSFTQPQLYFAPPFSVPTSACRFRATDGFTRKSSMYVHPTPINCRSPSTDFTSHHGTMKNKLPNEVIFKNMIRGAAPVFVPALKNPYPITSLRKFVRLKKCFLSL
jgi:hypothetical protein